MAPSPQVTRSLQELSRGRRDALDGLVPVVYEELRRIAHRQLRFERRGHTLNTTGLVHEAYLRLVDIRQVDWRERAHFFAMAARAMRRVLIDYARTRNREKRGGEGIRVSLSEATQAAVEYCDDLLALDDALARLERHDPRQCRVIEYRCFAGLTIEETATVLETSVATVKRDLASARAWLNRELREPRDDAPFDRIADRMHGMRSAIASIPPADLLERLQSGLAGRYRVERELARGGSALVFLAEDLRDGCKVALKVLQPRHADGIGPARFLKEIGIAARLSHPHILPLHDSGEIDGLLYQVMPYVDGESLRDRLRRQRPVGLSEALEIIGHVADALHYAHRHGIVHRDIKPENILLREREAIVTDFGIATAVATVEERSTETVVGTPAYMSPEQAGGKKTVDARSDQYSLACVLYEMLTGAPFITGASTREILRRNQTDPPEVATRNLARVPRPVIVALRRALARSSEDRFPSVLEFVEACRSAGEPDALNRQRSGGTRDRPGDSGTTSPDHPDTRPGAAG